MTTQVLVLVNGPCYEATLVTKDAEGKELSRASARGREDGKGVIEAWVSTDQTLEISEKYVAPEE